MFPSRFASALEEKSLAIKKFSHYAAETVVAQKPEEFEDW